MSVGADLVGAASLALAALAIFFSLWSPSLATALSVTRSLQRADRDDEIRIITSALRAQALPLAGASVAVGLILAPPAVVVLYQSVVRFVKVGFSSFAEYQAEQALFVLVWLLIGGLASMSVKAAVDLRMKRVRFERP